MKQQVVPVSEKTALQIASVPGDLQIVGWERLEVMAKTDRDKLEVIPSGDQLSLACDGDLILYAPRAAAVTAENVGGDVDVRAMSGPLALANIGGDLQLRNVSGTTVASVRGDMTVRHVQGDFNIASIGDDASVRQVQGSVQLGRVASDLFLRDVTGNINATVGGDAVLFIKPQGAAVCNLTAGGDILMRVPRDLDARLHLAGGSIESIRVDLPGVEAGQIGAARDLTLGHGTAEINLTAGDGLIVTSSADEWESMADFDSGARDESFMRGEFPGVPADLHERISRRVEEATRRAMEQAMRTQERVGRVMQDQERVQAMTERVGRRVEVAMRRVEDKMRAAERRSAQGASVGRWGAPPTPSAPPPPMPPSEPVSEDERLTILKMLQEKKISMADAEKLLSALEGK